MSALAEVLLWALRVNGKKDAAPHLVLEIKADASIEDAQNAFHKIARLAHPDLHRTTLDEQDLENVTQAYARAANAYQEFRNQRMSTTRLRPIGKGPAVPGVPSSPQAAQRAASTPSAGAPTVSSSTAAAQQMTSKALVYYRKAELALRRGDLKGATLQLKMAIAADPQSALLRTALAEVEAEVAKTT